MLITPLQSRFRLHVKSTVPFESNFVQLVYSFRCHGAWITSLKQFVLTDASSQSESSVRPETKQLKVERIKAFSRSPTYLPPLRLHPHGKGFVPSIVLGHVTMPKLFVKAAKLLQTFLPSILMAVPNKSYII